MPNRRVLISTIQPISGGVPVMAAFIARTLCARGYEPVLAHYQPYSQSPALSVPSFKLGRGRVGATVTRAIDGYETHAIGAWLPELEFTNYLATAPWKQVIASCGAHISVSGNVLAATAYHQVGLPFLAWVATGWDEDRKDRVARFPWARKLLDKTINTPVIRRLERKLLRAGTILALSQHTRRALDTIAAKAVTHDVLPMPVDTDFFSPAPERVVKGRIGFSGRFDDPRKNLDLLLQALSLLSAQGIDATALLIGGTRTDAITARIDQLGIAGKVELLPYLPAEELRRRLQTLDLFVLPSHQEGLCIAALEAMSCGCPVISTHCGGPEEYVVDGKTGCLVPFDAADMAAAIARILADRGVRESLATGARQMVQNNYTRDQAETVFWSAFDTCFGRQTPTTATLKPQQAS
jgi:glycosyltransferase involved in cell wall biosynthesis